MANAARSQLARYIGFALRHKAIGCVAPLVVVFLATTGLSFGLFDWIIPRAPREPLAIVNILETSPDGLVINEPAGATEAYFRALRSFDGASMMAVYHPVVRDEMLAGGATVERLQAALNEASARGARLGETRRLANIPLQDGRRYVFYIVTRTGFSADGVTEELYFVFTLDPSGRVLNIT